MAAFPDSSIAAQLSRIPGFDISKRVVMLGILILIMLIPLTMIGDLVYERSARRYEVENQIAGQWGGSQIVGGPVLMIPYVTRSNYVRADGSTGETVSERSAFFLPDKLAITPAWIANCGGAVCTRCWSTTARWNSRAPSRRPTSASGTYRRAISNGIRQCCSYPRPTSAASSAWMSCWQTGR